VGQHRRLKAVKKNFTSKIKCLRRTKYGKKLENEEFSGTREDDWHRIEKFLEKEDTENVILIK
jgi:hypothetical protein